MTTLYTVHQHVTNLAQFFCARVWRLRFSPTLVVFSVQCVVFSVQCVVFNVEILVFSIKHAVNSVHVYSIECILSSFKVFTMQYINILCIYYPL